VDGPVLVPRGSHPCPTTASPAPLEAGSPRVVEGVRAMPDLLLGGSAVTVEAGAGSGQPGQYAQPVKPEEIPPSCQSAVSTERTFVLVAMAAKDWKVTPSQDTSLAQHRAFGGATAGQ
jgi:hypothetical protein